MASNKDFEFDFEMNQKLLVDLEKGRKKGKNIVLFPFCDV